MGTRLRSVLVLALVVVLLVGAAGCIAGTGKYTEEKRANFWVGLLHGLLGFVTLVISLFTSAVDMYEIHNVGWGYDVGFFLGMAIILGGGGRGVKVACPPLFKKSKTTWGRIGDEIEREIKTEVLKALRSENDEQGGGGDEDWDEIGRKIEQKVKRKLKEWAEKD